MKKENNKDNYIMHSSYNDHFKLLTDAELGRLIRDVNNYVQNNVLPQYSSEERVINMAFSFMRTTIDIEKEKYIKKCEKNRENGKRGGRPKNPEKPNGLENNPEKPNARNNNPIDIEMDMDMDMDIDIDNKSVCNNVAGTRENEIICHLGSDYKSDSCFYCMKKLKCNKPESSDFKFKHPNENFFEWDKRKTIKMNEIVKSMKARGQPVNMNLFDYDWLSEEEN